MKTALKKHLLIVGIVFLALFLRLYQVVSIPPALSWDEVSIGYNAYSILKTGKDEHGNVMPLAAFPAYGDYKPPLSIYATVPFVAIFGLNELAVRLPSALAGVLTVLFTYFFVKELFNYHIRHSEFSSESKSKIKQMLKRVQHDKNQHYVTYISLITATLLAISPWHIQLSRAGFEANIAVMFSVLGALLVLSARKHSNVWLVAWLPFVLAMYTFNSSRYFVPLLGLSLLFFSWKEVIANKKQFAYGVVIAFVTLLPTVPHLVSPEARLRFKEVNIFTEVSVVEKANTYIQHSPHRFIGNILHNRRVGYIRSYITHFFHHFDLRFLFIRGDGNPKFSTQDTGQLLFFELPLLFIGVMLMLRRHRNVGMLLIVWLLAAIVPAATARETPHALRIENTLPVWQIFIAYAIFQGVPPIRRAGRSLANTAGRQKSRQYGGQAESRRIGVMILLLFLYLGSFGYFYHNYFNHYAKEYSGEWQYGYKQAIEYAQTIEHNYSSIVLTGSIGRPYMYTAFFTKLDPKEFHRTIDGSFDSAGFYNSSSLGTWQFTREGVREYDADTLYILDPHDVPDEANVIKDIDLLNGDRKLVVFDVG